MASERILVVGTMRNGDTHLRVAPLTADNEHQEVISAIEMGRYLFEQGASRWACLNVHPEGSREAGWNEAAELETLMDGIEDEDYHRSGNW